MFACSSSYSVVSLLLYGFSWLRNTVNISSLLTVPTPQGCADGPAFLLKSVLLMWFHRSKLEHPHSGHRLHAELSSGLWGWVTDSPVGIFIVVYLMGSGWLGLCYPPPTPSEFLVLPEAARRVTESLAPLATAPGSSSRQLGKQGNKWLQYGFQKPHRQEKEMKTRKSRDGNVWTWRHI